MSPLPARAWALAGLVLLLGRASVSLLLKGYREILSPPLLSPLEWASFAAIVVLFVWGEGWMALHRRWAPRVAARIRALNEDSGTASLLLAPVYALGLTGGPRRTMVRSWAGVAAIVVAVVVVRQLAQPWQGMVKLSVAGALAVGVASLAVRWFQPGATDGEIHPRAGSTPQLGASVPAGHSHIVRE